MVEINYQNAEFYDDGADADKSEVFQMVFGEQHEEGNYGPVGEEVEALVKSDDVDVPDELTVTEVRMDEKDEKMVDIYVRVAELTVGTQTTRGRHPVLVYRGGAYDHYRVALEA